MTKIMSEVEEKRAEIRRLVAEYYAAAFAPRPFTPGKRPPSTTPAASSTPTSFAPASTPCSTSG